MANVTVYRVQRPDPDNPSSPTGKGPYNGCAYDYSSRNYKRTNANKLRTLLDSHSCDPAHPTPTSDGIGYFLLTKDHFFGFASMEDLKNWFDEDCLKLLKKCGFKIKEFSVPEDDVIRGGKQIAFTL